MSFNKARLSIARERRMLSQKRFAELAGVAAHTVSRCEKGLHVPSDETVDAFARALDFPRGFFFGGDLDRPTDASFRSQAALTAATRDAALAAGSVGFLVSDWVDERFNLPSADLPDLQHYEPDIAARVLRETWGLGERPISNMVRLLEAKGARVFSLTEETKRLNAFSLWRGGRPFVFLNTFKSAECSRFDAAHELAHLVLHQAGQKGRPAEDQANRFAAELLMPAGSVVSRLPRVRGVPELVAAKSFWKVSVAALNHRVHRLGVTSEWHYRDLCIQIARLGYNTCEPEPIERETSVVWKKVLHLLWQERKSVAALAAELHLPQQEVSALLFGLLDTRTAATASPPLLHLVGEPA